MTKKRVDDFVVLSKKHLGGGNVLMELKPRSDTATSSLPVPGQFVEVSVRESGDAFLRRPISVCDFSSESGVLTLLVKEVGPGTRYITSRREGDSLNIIWPLGHGFSFAPAGTDVILCGGGVGVAPLLYLAKMLRQRDVNPHFVIGARTASQLMLVDEFRILGPIDIMTDDGSQGSKGLVTDSAFFSSLKPAAVYCCGPKPMMIAVAAKAASINCKCEVSLENMMACGMGACLGCVENTKEGNVCVCSAGPVFNSNLLQWF